MRRLLVLVAIGSFAAGCLTSSPDAAPDAPPMPPAAPDWPAKAIVFGGEHDHRDWAQHVGMSTPNFAELAYDPLPTDFYDGQSAGGYFCGGNATTSEGRELTIISSLDTDVAFVLVDVTDPAHPEKVGEYVIEGTTHYDVDITADGKYVVIGSDVDPGGVLRKVPRPGLGLAATGVRPVWRDACGNERVAGPEEQVPLSPATLLVDITDPTSPTLVDALPAPVFGPHSVSTTTIDGVYWVAASITNLARPVDYFQVMQIQELPTGPKLVLLSQVDGSQYSTGADDPFGGHVDAEIALHPVTNTIVAYLSNWGGGLVILDLSNPAAPLPISTWVDAGASNGQMHSTRSIDGLWDDRHYVIAGQEFTQRPEDRGSGWIYIIDDTDPAQPTEVARWTLPLDTEAHWKSETEDGVETWSTHYFRLVDRTLFVAMYHGGVWAVDLTNVSEPRSAGVFVPDKAPPAPRHEPTGLYELTPFVLDIFPQPDFTMSVYDGYSGLYMVKFDPTLAMPRVKEWPQSGQAHEDG